MVPNSIPMLNFKPSRSRKTTSVLINHDIFKLFAKWIDNKNNDYTQQNIPYKFNLLLRGTRDGFDPDMFHQLCDDKGATITIARIKDSKQIVGGYNPLSWNLNGSYMNTSESFLFYITDVGNLSSAKIGRVFRYHQNAIYSNSGYGPTFGNGHDLNAQDKSWSANSGNAYTNINIPSSFTIDEYEVFQVAKKSL
ncbi:unnamed protein product [Rhizophagus irregularis]|nr:unnamed protein product [Rhizophagus irregularis]